MNERPQLIYRYRSFHPEYLAKEIRDGEIFFCRLDSFNDPYEGRLKMNLQVDHDSWVALVKSLGAAPPPTQQDWQRSLQVFGRERMDLIERMRRLISSMSPSEIQRTASLIAALPGLKPMIGGLNTHQEPLRQRTVVACFTELKNDPVMFAHYADVHKGVCLQYATKQAREFFPVTYSDQIPEMSAKQIADGVDRMIRDFALTKSSHWKTEREWRIIYHPFPQASLRTHGMVLQKVYVGVGATKEVRNSIREWCSCSRYSNVQFHELKLSESGYELVEG